MTRVVEASPQVLAMRNPKTETKQQFMDRAEKLADELWVEPVVDEITEQEPETVAAPVSELEYLRWFYQNADFGPADSDVRAHMLSHYKAMGNTVPRGYEEE